MNTVTALGHSRDPRLAEGGRFVALFESSKQEVELQQLHREERLVKVPLDLPCYKKRRFNPAVRHGWCEGALSLPPRPPHELPHVAFSFG